MKKIKIKKKQKKIKMKMKNNKKLQIWIIKNIKFYLKHIYKMKELQKMKDLKNIMMFFQEFYMYMQRLIWV